MKKIKILFIVIITWCLQLNAVVYRVTEMVNGAGKQCYLFYVEHYTPSDINNANTLQRRDFIELAQNYGAAVIVEDAYIYNFNALCKNPILYNNNDFYCTLPLLLLFKQDQDILYGLSAYCYNAGIPVTNVECRFFDCMGSPKIINESLKILYSQICTYDDGPLLNEIYKQGLEKNNKDLEIIEKKFQEKQKFTIIPHSLYSFGSDLNFYTSHLLDMKILHQFAAYEKEFETIFIAAGGWHSKNIRHYLSKLGYKVKKTIVIHNSARMDDASLRNIFSDHFNYKFHNKSSPSLVHWMLSLKYFCDATPLKYLINRYGAICLLGAVSYVLLSYGYPIDPNESKAALIHALIASTIAGLGLKLIPKILNRPLIKQRFDITNS